MPQKLLRLPQVIERTRLNRATIYQKLRDGPFPKPVQLHLRINAWVEAEIDAWIEERIAHREAA